MQSRRGGCDSSPVSCCLLIGFQHLPSLDIMILTPPLPTPPSFPKPTFRIPSSDFQPSREFVQTHAHIFSGQADPYSLPTVDCDTARVVLCESFHVCIGWFAACLLVGLEPTIFSHLAKTADTGIALLQLTTSIYKIE